SSYSRRNGYCNTPSRKTRTSTSASRCEPCSNGLDELRLRLNPQHLACAHRNSIVRHIDRAIIAHDHTRRSIERLGDEGPRTIGGDSSQPARAAEECVRRRVPEGIS